jgi:NAD(P)H-dependent flavin oxidoreductase YrpB (nitropropane dioxygenase family)
MRERTFARRHVGVHGAANAAHPDYKRALIAADARDAVLTRAYSAGDPVETVQRVLRSALVAAETFDGATAGEVVIGGERVSVPRFGSLPPTEGSTGKLDAMALYAGQSVGGVTAVQPAAEIVTELAAMIPRLGAARA